MFKTVLLGILASALTLANLGVYAYIPASPTNNTNAAIQQGLNVSDVSKLHLQWYSTGSLLETVSYQLVGAESPGWSQGALVHFTEDMSLNNETTTTPWIALVACDNNSTSASQEDDIFTLARDRGAKAALLYSIYSQECIINPEYADPTTFDQVLDIFSTQSLTTAILIEYQFGQFGSKNESIYGSYNANRLNSSGSMVNETFGTNSPQAPGYIFATLTAYNATGAPDTDTTGNGSDTSGQGGGSGGGGGSTNTGLAMIILYAITGCVSALFCVVIISGAVRAIRHPERYGPRARHNMGGGSGPMQSRARGLTRAIVDTFPIVKFGGAPSIHQDEHNSSRRASKELESPSSSRGVRDSTLDIKEWEVLDIPIEMIERGDGDVQHIHATDDNSVGVPESAGAIKRNSHHSQDDQPRASGSRLNSPQGLQFPDDQAHGTESTSRPRKAPGNAEDVVPAAIGRETCPICIVDFEDGDDLRLLPCEGKHRFHKNCVDPWLLELSSSCPICRQDFQALGAMLSGEDDTDYDSPHSPHATDDLPMTQGNNEPAPPIQNQSRFSRYLRFARRRRNDQDFNTDRARHERTNTSSLSIAVVNAV